MIPRAVDNVMLVISDVGVMALIAIFFGQVYRALSARLLRTLLLGLLFGAAGVHSALSHGLLPNTLHADFSGIFVGLAAAFLGWPGAAMALVPAGVARLWLMDMPLWLVASDLLLAALAGGLWSTLVRGSDRGEKRALLMLGVLVSAALLPTYFWPSTGSGLARSTAALATLGISTAIAVLLGSFIERERSLMEGERHLRIQASTDQLTGLLNRGAIEAGFRSRSFQGPGQALLLIDIDNFKSINDAHGHGAGDQVLRQIAGCLHQSVRNGDVVARFGGEEFAVLLSAHSLEEALATAERLRTAVERNRVRINQLALAVTVSVGVAWWHGAGNFAEQYEIADTALYDAKRTGRNRVKALPQPLPPLSFTAQQDQAGEFAVRKM